MEIASNPFGETLAEARAMAERYARLAELARLRVLELERADPARRQSETQDREQQQIEIVRIIAAAAARCPC